MRCSLRFGRFGGFDRPSSVAVVCVCILGPPVVPFCPFWGEGSPTKIDCRKKGTLIPTSPLSDLVYGGWPFYGCP